MARGDKKKPKSKDSGKGKKVTLPPVDPKNLRRLNEGVEPKKDSGKKR